MCALQPEPRPRARIETDRLILRSPELEDAVYIAELANDAEVARMTTGIRHPYRLSDAEAFISQMAAGDGREDRPLLIEHRDFGPIGMTGFHRHPPSGLMEVGYWLGHTFRRRGFATEAVHAALVWAHEGWGKRAVLSSHFADNLASARVLEKTGFLYTGDVERRFSLGRGQEADTRMMVWLAP
ncbi:GNAT family N-acetyltransferase [Caulobacter sp. S45]|uniref:GNAT family N-acetyltransferase n=1 Tax=Caulobacter sp. S45 TaxID=1641861 RepID=UPI00131D0B6D|nr:GNAT family N-acetyltransferase [Caulobacter sp. S45]